MTHGESVSSFINEGAYQIALKEYKESRVLYPGFELLESNRDCKHFVINECLNVWIEDDGIIRISHPDYEYKRKGITLYQFEAITGLESKA